MAVNPRSDRSDSKPVTSPSPVQGVDQAKETSITSAKDRLDSAYPVDIKSVGRTPAPAPRNVTREKRHLFAPKGKNFSE